MKASMIDVLTVYSGKTFCDSSFDVLMDRIGRFLSGVSGHTVFTHDINRIARHVRPYMLAQLPWLADLDIPSINGNTCFDVLKQFEKEYGSVVEIYPMPSGFIPEMDPVESLRFAGVDESKIVITEG